MPSVFLRVAAAHRHYIEKDKLPSNESKLKEMIRKVGRGGARV